ncbi:MAG: FKBP-type peptidyl-prolyl cis-trans isomerase [Bacteroides sp.]|nr:FKBP-type peptidyl-prolyl cis-trans isomerase [Bacteroides sp.]MCM1420346.1 FKBP-type peptidyl-prolyl cis-trans isomerase [Bacteroides sp.]
MKKILLSISLLLMAGAVAVPSYAAGEYKEKKEKADKTVKKEKKKSKKGKAADGGSFEIVKPELTNGGDSIAYIFGTWQSNGLQAYMENQLGIDSAYVNDFIQGIMDKVSIDPSDKKMSAYSAGQQIGNQIDQMAQGLERDYYAADPDKRIDKKIVANAIVAALVGKNEITSDSAQLMFKAAMDARHEVNKEAMYGSNRRAGEAFLAENKKKEGVITLPSGLQYKVITEGNGEKPLATDKVKVDYEGRLIDGTVFDSSYKRGAATSFQCNQVIKGWTEALQKMPVGSKWELYIPYQLAYGDRETGKDIKPYSALIFTVELHEIEGKSEKTDLQAEKKTAPVTKKKTRK